VNIIYLGLEAALLLSGGSGLLTIFGIARRGLWSDFPRCLLLGLALCGTTAAATAATSRGPSVVAGALVVAAVTGFLLRKRRGTGATATSRFPLAAFCLLLPLWCAAGYFAFTVPVAFGDELTLWCYKSSIFAEFKSFDPRMWTLAESRGPAYPPAIPAAGALASIPTGSFDPAGCRLVALLGFVAFGCAATSLFEKLQFGALRTLAAVALSMTPLVAGEAWRCMADVTFTTALLVACETLLFERPSTAALFVAIPAAIKLEGAPMGALLAIAAAASLETGRWRFLLGAAASLAAVTGPWFASLLLAFGLHPATGIPLGADSRLEGSLPVIASRFAESAASLLKAFLPWSAFSAVAPGILLAGAAGATSEGVAPPHPRRVTLVALSAALVAGQCLPLAVAPNFAWQLEVVAPRAAMHLLPALILAAATLRQLDRPPSFS
jgi:hypothetical protein